MLITYIKNKNPIYIEKHSDQEIIKEAQQSVYIIDNQDNYTEVQLLKMKTQHLFGSDLAGVHLVVDLKTNNIEILFPSTKEVLEIINPYAKEATFAPTSDEEIDLYNALIAKHGIATYGLALNTAQGQLYKSILSTFIGDQIVRSLPFGGVHIVGDIQIDDTFLTIFYTAVQKDTNCGNWINYLIDRRLLQNDYLINKMKPIHEQNYASKVISNIKHSGSTKISESLFNAQMQTRKSTDLLKDIQQHVQFTLNKFQSGCNTKPKQRIPRYKSIDKELHTLREQEAQLIKQLHAALTQQINSNTTPIQTNKTSRTVESTRSHTNNDGRHSFQGSELTYAQIHSKPKNSVISTRTTQSWKPTDKQPPKNNIVINIYKKSESRKAKRP